MIVPMILFLVYAAGFIILWIYAGFSEDWDMKDGDDVVGMVFFSMFWPLVLVFGCIYLFFKGLLNIGWLLRCVPKVWTWLLIKY